LTEVDPLLSRVMLVNARDQLELSEGDGHLEGAGGVHVGRHDWHPGPGARRVTESVSPLQTHLRARLQSASLGSDENIFEVEFDVFFNTRHGSGLGSGLTELSYRERERERD
jgi:hypothetical protein